MSLQAVLPIWQTVQGRFQKSVQSLTEKNLHLQLGSAAIGPMLLHNAEVEYMFADWFFGAAIPAEIQAGMDARAAKGYAFDFSLEELIAYLQASSQHLIAAMKALPEQRWETAVESRIGASTPAEAVGRLIYHMGIHAGQMDRHYPVASVN